jgi:hypothetical protein
MDPQAFHVPAFLDALGGMAARWVRPWVWMGVLESLALQAEIAATPLVRPICVCGLARSGSTLLHEVIAAHPGVATHRMKDYPFVSTPFWWRRATAGVKPGQPRERSHADRMMVTPDSPDALEEMVWMAFFPRCHDPAEDNRLTGDVPHPAFEMFYRNHLRKLLLAEGAGRYVAKANYHVARLPYLLRLFPDARIVLPVRPPEGHIASLIRQQTRFAAGHRQYPRSLRFMQRSGHFEFGLDRRPINLGDLERVSEIQADWSAGREVPGWAKYWDHVHGYLAELLAADASVRKATLVVRYDELCARPAEVLSIVFAHCDLKQPGPVIDRCAGTIAESDYYASPFTREDRATIRQLTGETAARLGFG